MDRNEILEAADLEGRTNVALDDLDKFEGEIGIEQMRTIPGTEDMSDQEVMKLWSEVQAEQKAMVDASGAKDGSQAQAEAVANAVDGTAVKTARGWKVYDDKGQEVTDVDNMTVKQFLSSKIGYNANKAEQRKSFDEMVRVTQLGHLNERKLSELQGERQRLAKEIETLTPELSSSRQLIAATRYALVQYNVGNAEPLSKLLEAVKSNLGKDGMPSADRGTAQVEAPSTSHEAEGQRIWFEEIQPMADAIASKFGAKQQEVRNAVSQYIDNEPNLTREKIDLYINEEIPILLQQVGYKEGGAVKPDTSELDAVRKELAELKSKRTIVSAADVRARMKQIPNSARGDTGEGGTPNDDPNSVVPANVLNDPAKFKQWLKDR